VPDVDGHSFGINHTCANRYGKQEAGEQDPPKEKVQQDNRNFRISAECKKSMQGKEQQRGANTQNSAREKERVEVYESVVAWVVTNHEYGYGNELQDRYGNTVSDNGNESGLALLYHVRTTISRC
jgi:hypothetical protein